MRLRDPQVAGVTAIVTELKYRESTLRVACTGFGKTHEQAVVTRLELRRRRGRVLWIAPREEILEQAAATCAAWTNLRVGPQIAFEQGARRAHAGAQVTMGSIQTLMKPERLAAVPAPTLVIADEVHLYLDALRGIWNELPHVKKAGWTATPDRGDSRRLVPALFESVAAIYELPRAIDEGYLVRPVFERVDVEGLELDESDFTVRGKDFDPTRLGEAMSRPELLLAVAQAVRDGTGERQTIVFCCSIAHAEKVQRLLEAAGESSRLIHGRLPATERREALEDYRAGAVRTLVSVDILTYGVDLPETGALVLARPTTSRALYSQMIGRGLRLCPGKEDCRVIDLALNVGRHVLVTPKDALRPAKELDEHRRKAPSPRDDVREELEEELEAVAEEEKDRELMSRSQQLTWQKLDTMAALLGADLGDAETAAGSTNRQVAYLARNGVPGGELLSRDQASRMIEQIQERERSGRCTFRQALVLQRLGLNPHARREVADVAMGRLKTNGWRVTRRLLLDLPQLQYTSTRPTKVTR